MKSEANFATSALPIDASSSIVDMKTFLVANIEMNNFADNKKDKLSSNSGSEQSQHLSLWKEKKKNKKVEMDYKSITSFFMSFARMTFELIAGKIFFQLFPTLINLRSF